MSFSNNKSSVETDKELEKKITDEATLPMENIKITDSDTDVKKFGGETILTSFDDEKKIQQNILHSVNGDDLEDHDVEPDAPWYKGKLFTVCIFILFVEMCERLTYYTIMGTQRSQLTTVFHYSNSQASSINAAFGILSYLMCVVGGWVADSLLGRFKTVILFAGIYIVGVMFTTIASAPTIENLALYFTGTMALITIGTGGIKPNIANLGADQYDLIDGTPRQNEREKKAQTSFFNFFYLAINLGAIIAYGYLVTLATNGAGSIPQKWGYFSAYAIAGVSMFFALVIFLIGSPKYRKKLPGGNSLGGLFYYLVESAKKSTKGKFALLGWFGMCLFLFLAVVQAFILDSTIATNMSYTSLAVALVSCAILCICHKENSHLDGIAEHKEGIMTVLEAKGTLDTIPTLLIANVCFSISYNAMNGPFQSQACQSDLLIGNTQLNGSFFNIADCIAIVIFVPLLEFLVFPGINKLKGSPVTMDQKLIAGLLASVLSVLLATVGEYVRRSSPILTFTPPVYSHCAPVDSNGVGVEMSSFSSMYMFLPFAIMGLGEVLINPVLLHFSYDQAPPRTRSLTQAFNLVACGALSNGFTAPITTALAPYYTDNLNDGHLEYIYYVSAGVGIIGIPLYLYFSKSFKEKDWEAIMAEEEAKKKALEKSMTKRDSELIY
eukprot:Awhi_evm1s13157